MIGEPLAEQLQLSALLILITSAMHLAGLSALIWLVRVHRRLIFPQWRVIDPVATPMLLILGLFVLHGAEIAVWAAAYLHVNMVRTLEEGLFLSTALYSTLGEGSIADVRQWRLFAATEGLNGFLLIGWSTAFLLQVVQTLREEEESLSAQLHPEQHDRSGRVDA